MKVFIIHLDWWYNTTCNFIKYLEIWPGFQRRFESLDGFILAFGSLPITIKFLIAYEFTQPQLFNFTSWLGKNFFFSM